MQLSTSSNIEDWTLHPLIEVNRELNLIKEETAIQVRLAKDFRNLIHQGVSIRKQPSQEIRSADFS